MKTIEERLEAVAKKLAEKETAKKAIVEKYRPEKDKKLTTEQRLTRIEEALGILK